MTDYNLPQHMTESEEAWLESESIFQLRKRVRGSQNHALATILLLLAVLSTHISLGEWFIWAVIHAVVYLTRSLLIGKPRSDGISTDQNNESAKILYLRYIYVLAAVGFVWGSTVYLFSSNAPSFIDAICFTTVIIYGVGTAINLSIHFRSLIFFIRGYCTGLLGAFFARVYVDHQVDIILTNVFLITVVVLLALILEKFGKQLNQANNNSLLLEHRNILLIKSLTKEKQSALDAVATKNRMLASAAHDMRQPVLALDLYAGWLTEDPTASTEIVPKITAATKAVINLFDSLFDMSRLTEGQVSTSLEEVNLNDLMSALYVQYQPIAMSKNLTLRVRAVQQSKVITDYLLLERIMGNLITNAIKYTHSGGVLLACRKSSRGVKIEVWDTGIGISRDQQDLVFKEFYKSPCNTGTSDGFGLGLSIVSQLVDLIGAELTLKSRIKQGTLVSVHLGQAI